MLVALCSRDRRANDRPILHRIKVTPAPLLCVIVDWGNRIALRTAEFRIAQMLQLNDYLASFDLQLNVRNTPRPRDPQQLLEQVLVLHE
jgi:hypothetical protein